MLPLRHPLHTAKAAASADQLTGGRLVLGIASGDAPSNSLRSASSMKRAAPLRPARPGAAPPRADRPARRPALPAFG
ncbi:LLM class flavin-dependent oxidoreductase [Cupriavidus sp. IDO]|uniref:LLM class flavin-dependent oxidoreductase n=1 Tax=Cupriavidus sp. IDO TaxID=1539142 RepID=UPI003FCD4A26